MNWNELIEKLEVGRENGFIFNERNKLAIYKKFSRIISQDPEKKENLIN